MYSFFANHGVVKFGLKNAFFKTINCIILFEVYDVHGNESLKDNGTL